MPWLQLQITSSPNEANAIESAMMQTGASAVTMEDNADQPIFEPNIGETPLWSATRITGLFEASINTESTLEQFKKKYRKELSSCRWHILEDKDWEREWEKNYHPIQCGDDFWICPSWIEPPDKNATNLMLDPGLAFGTGTHPTTFMCLQWIAKQDVSNKDVIDYGCGSGILGIAALLRGAQQAIGVDIDPQALLSTQNNAKANGIAEKSFPVFLPKNAPSQACDLVLANILAGPLVELAPTILALVKPGGSLCLSGVIKSQQQSIIDAYAPALIFDEISQNEEWICLCGSKSA